MNLLFIQIRVLSLLIQNSKIVYHNNDESKSILFLSSRIAFNSHPYYPKGGVSMGEGIGGGIGF